MFVPFTGDENGVRREVQVREIDPDQFRDPEAEMSEEIDEQIVTATHSRGAVGVIQEALKIGFGKIDRKILGNGGRFEVERRVNGNMVLFFKESEEHLESRYLPPAVVWSGTEERRQEVTEILGGNLFSPGINASGFEKSKQPMEIMAVCRNGFG